SMQRDLIQNLNWYFIVIFFIVGASTIYKIITDWAKQLRERQQLQTQTMQSELRFLKSQINPHFLFNTLNNLYALTLKKDERAPEIVIKLSEMMRYMLYECNEKRVLLSKEINYLKNYLDLEKLRQGKHVKISFHCQGDAGTKEIAPLMFIPFLENSFKHGLSHQINEGFVNIILSIDGKTVDFYIENSKPETPPMTIMSKKKSGGIGLVNVQRRLNLLYPDQYELKIHDNPKSYAVNLSIDL
ncbi:MAG: histidine kinase, partial [Bacteroidota bacterium]